MPSLLHTSLLVALGVVGGGCSAVVDAGRVQCSTDADCTKRGAEFASTTCVESVCQALDAWSCTKHSTLEAKSSTKVSVDFNLMEAILQQPMEGVQASLCGKLDLECSAPFATTQSTSEGKVHFEIAPLFDGYVQLLEDDYDPTMVFLPPTIESVDLGMLPLASNTASQLLGAQLNKTINPEKGRVLVTTTGCDQQAVGGVTVLGDNMGDDATRFYAVGGLPTFTETATDPSGFAGFFNVDPGSVTLTASIEDSGQTVGRVGIMVRAGYVSMRRIQPWTD